MDLDEQTPAGGVTELTADTRPATAGVEWAREYVYGTMSTLVAISGLSFEKHPDSVSAGGVILVGALAIALAHAVSNLVVDWSKQSPHEPFTHHTVLVRLRQAWPIVSAALPALAVLAIARSGLYSTTTGLYVADGVGVAALAFVGVATAGGAHQARTRRGLYVASLVVVGLCIVGLELLTHHV